MNLKQLIEKYWNDAKKTSKDDIDLDFWQKGSDYLFPANWIGDWNVTKLPGEKKNET